ncbi:MAG: hypothetical protein KDA47_00950 [Planctomycetales bacterium]|nr:hypothetical protein [Planctomycetales bacterium]
MSRPLFAMLLACGVWTAVTVRTAEACPFCAAVSQTFSEEIDTMDAVVIARLVEPPPPAKPGEVSDEVPKAKFEIVEALKGQALVAGSGLIETIYFGEGKKGEMFLVMGVDPPKLMWSTPLQLSPRAADYVRALPSLPAEGHERLKFFQPYLEDKDEMLARDAYDEFARAPYDAVKGLKSDMNHDQLLAWIQDPNVPASRRRLYLTMLGICGSDGDLALLEGMLKSDDRKMKSGLDALIGCYLTLKGADGLPLVEELFLKDAKAEYADTYAAIMALRFHGTEGGVIPRERVLESLHYMLDRPQLADLVIPDLARWEDWSQMAKLVELFKTSDDKTSWVRVPVINYLRACPDPEAKKYLVELEKIDPASVKRANTFFPFTPAGSKKDTTEEKPKTSSINFDDNVRLAAALEPVDLTVETPANETTLGEATDGPVAAPIKGNAEVAEARTEKANSPADELADTSRQKATAARLSSAALAVTPATAKAEANRLTVLGVALVVGVILMLLQWTLLTGARPVPVYVKND